MTATATAAGISVLTLVKGRLGHLLQLVEGLNRSTRPPDELVIVDMNPEPIAKPHAAFPVQLIRLAEATLPLAKARNRAAARARHAQLLFLDVDCIPMRDLIGHIAAGLSENDALICAEVKYLAATEARGAWDETQLKATAVAHTVRQFPQHGLRQEPNAGLFWSLAFGIRKRTFEILGGFDERFEGYGAEDTDFGFRASKAGLNLLFMGDAGVFHQHHTIFDPPLQHFEDIIRNALTFHRIWNIWPMEGWLTQFEALGLILRQGGELQRLRSPTAFEVSAARKADSFRF